MSAFEEPANDVRPVTPVAAAVGNKTANAYYRGIMVNTDGVYNLETPGSVGTFRAVPLAANVIYGIRFLSVKNDNPGNVYGIL